MQLVISVLSLTTAFLPYPGSAAEPDKAAAQIKAWTDMADALRPLSEKLSQGSPSVDRERAVAGTNWMLLTAIGQYVVNFRAADRQHPQFTPFLNNVLDNGAPVPDYIYQIALVDGHGTYRLSGRRGTSRDVEISMLDGLDGARPNGSLVGRFSLNDINIAPDGTFSVILSTERPQDYNGDWIKLDATAATLLVRHVAYDWKKEVDARLVLDRLDVPARGQPVQPADVIQRLSDMLRWTEVQTGEWHEHIVKQREAGNVNRLKPFNFQGGLKGQMYLEGLFDIDDDHALLVETEVPAECRYWSILATDNEFATIDWMTHQSSLNAFQARLDADRKFRAVIATHDPGVPNWIDTAGLKQGVIQLRWNNCSSQPMPKVTKVALAKLRKTLPADTPTVDAAARDRALRDRREGAQLRIRW